MITPEEIRKKALRKFTEVLQAQLNKQSIFPLRIKAGISPSKDYVLMSKEIALLMSASKNRKGKGYTVVSEKVNTRKHGLQDTPRHIEFETRDDYLAFLNKKEEFRAFCEDAECIIQSFPQLGAWVQRNALYIIDYKGKWGDIIKVCRWFVHDYAPNMYYIRELPIEVHTKFIEENKGILQSLLNELIADKLNSNQSTFEKRFRLRYNPPLIRFRLLDDALKQDFPYDDMSVPAREFSINGIDCEKVYIIENLMNFLTMPQHPKSIALWGKGYAIECLKDVVWLKEKEVYYWSDMDVQGFQMLSQVRSYFPQTQSILMEMSLLSDYKNFLVLGTPAPPMQLQHLNPPEKDCYQYLHDNNIRLEQERIPQKVLAKRLILQR